MPQIRYFIVTQTREVRVSANTVLDAADLAERVFSGTKKPEDQLNVQSEVKEINLNIREDI